MALGGTRTAHAGGGTALNLAEWRPRSKRGATDANERSSRVVHVLSRMEVGGVERRLVELTEELSKHGVCVTVVATSGRGGSLDSEVVRLGGDVIPCRLDATFPLRFARLLIRLRPAAVHSHIALPTGLVLLLARLSGVEARIAHFRSDSDGKPLSGLRKIRNRALSCLINHNATSILGVSNESLTNAMGSRVLRDPRAEVIPNGFDTQRLLKDSDRPIRAELGAMEDDLVLVHVGRASAEKNRPKALEIANSLDSHRSTHLALVGPALQEEESASCPNRPQPSRNIHFVGLQDSPGPWLIAADAMILPSLREGQPGAVLEALALGTPVVASDLPGLRELAREFRQITLVDPQASPSVWKDAVLVTVNDWPRRTRDVAACVAGFNRSRYSICSATQHLLGIYGLKVERTIEASG